MFEQTPATYKELYKLLGLFNSAWHSVECRSGNISMTLGMINEALDRYPIPDELSTTLDNIIHECEQQPIDQSMVNILIAEGLEWKY